MSHLNFHLTIIYYIILLSHFLFKDGITMNDKKTSELLNTLNSIDNYKSLKTYISKDLDVKELTISDIS